MASALESRDAHNEATKRESYFRPEHVAAVSLDTVGEALANTTLIGDGATSITGISLDSRAVLPGDLYAALPGAHTHGAQFIAGARERGAAAVLTDEAGRAAALEAGLPALIVSDPRAALGAASATIYATAKRQPQLFGVTGTNGKTTTTFMLTSLLQAMGKRTATIGTIGIEIAGDYLPSTMTTPEAPQLHGLIGRMADAAVDAAMMEVSSHSMVFGRISGVRLDVAGFTNLTQDHLDLHGTMQEYFAAKLSLFEPEHVRHGVIVIDDEWGKRAAREAGVPVTTISSDGSDAGDWSVSNVQPDGFGNTFDLGHRDGRSLRVSVGMPGAFNVTNAALALVMLIEAGVEPAALEAAVWSDVRPLSRDVPGRMELVSERPTVYVDFAHNPGGMLSVLESVQSLAGRVIIVFGAAGERDALKRGAMGEIAARLADVSIITDDDPHREDAAAIRAQVMAGALDAQREGCEVLEIYPRAEAIARAVAMAHDDDVVIVAGRGHETSQDMSGTTVMIDDRDEVRKAIAARA